MWVLAGVSGSPAVRCIGVLEPDVPEYLVDNGLIGDR
jgi:hypothetical protein